MSTSEFDEQLSGKENDLLAFSCKEKGLPDDFSEEDMAFARELESLFSPQDEEIPPYFAQTLLEPEQLRFRVAEQGFEQKTYAHVFRRLKLRRRLFRSSQTPLHLSKGIIPARRPLMALFAACMLVALVTIITTGNSFAAGMAILWSGAHSGVLQSYGYPKELLSRKELPSHVTQKQIAQHPVRLRFQQISLLNLQQKLSFPLYWPGSTPDLYDFDSVSILTGPDQTWANGPILQLNYDYSLPGVKAHGTGHIAIREFKPTGEVLQVVQTGAAHQIAVGNNGSGQVAVYVDGQWGQRTKVSQAWVYGTRSELIYEHNGVIFWIVGDQRDGINGAVLQNIAASMASFNISRAMHKDNHVDIMETVEDVTPLFYGDVIYLDGPDGTSWNVVGQSSSISPVSRQHAIESMNP